MRARVAELARQGWQFCGWWPLADPLWGQVLIMRPPGGTERDELSLITERKNAQPIT